MKVVESRQFSRWLEALKDRPATRKIQSWMYRMTRSDELLGDWKHVGSDLLEFRFFVGAGYRVHASIQDGGILILLGGGSKSTQARDIRKAERLLRSWRSIR